MATLWRFESSSRHHLLADVHLVLDTPLALQAHSSSGATGCFQILPVLFGVNSTRSRQPVVDDFGDITHSFGTGVLAQLSRPGPDPSI